MSLEEKISEFMERQAEEQKLARKKEKLQVCINPDSYIGKEILYQTALLREILMEIRNQKKEKVNTLYIEDSSPTASPVASWSDIMASANTSVLDLKGKACFGGISFDKINGFAAVALVFPYDGKLILIQHTFICRKNDDLKYIAAPLDEWVQAGEAEWVDDVEIPAELVAGWFQGKMNDYTILKIAIDNFHYVMMNKALKEIGFDAYENKNVTLTRQSDITPSIPYIESLFKNRRIVAGDVHIWRWYVNNTVTVRKGNLRVYKKINSYRQIDGFLAFLEAMALYGFTI